MHKTDSQEKRLAALKRTKHYVLTRLLTESRTLVIMLLGTCLSTLALTPTHISLAVGDVDQKGKYVIRNELEVNNHNEYKAIIYKNEAEGVSEMRSLVANSQIEECWVYLPGHEKWIEIGYNEEPEKKTHDSYITKTKLDIRMLDELMNENNNMAVYHFHSSYCLYFEDKMKARKENGIPMSVNEREREEIRFLIKSAYPSSSDLMNMIGNTIKFFEKNSDGHITFKICSHYGITEYGLTEEGITHFSADNAFQQIIRITSLCSSANLDANVTGAILELNPGETRNPLVRIKMSPKQKRESFSRYKKIDPLSKVTKSIEAMNGDYLIITFTPYR